MDDVITNPNDSSLLSTDMPSCLSNCPMRAKFSELEAAHAKELEERDFQIALRNTIIEGLTGQRTDGEKAEHMRELLTVFKTCTFSGSSMKLTEAQVQSFVEEQRKKQGEDDPAPGDKKEPAPGQNDSSGQGDNPGGDGPSPNSTDPSGNTQNGGTPPPGGNGGGTTGTESTRRGRPQGSTGSFMDHVSPENQADGGIVGLPEEERKCPRCGSTMEHMGFKKQESLTLVPAKFVKTTTRYETYYCKNCKKEGVTVVKQTPMPRRFLYHCAVEPEVVAHFAVQKLLLGVPMNTQAQDHQSHGMPISRQDICNYLLRAGDQYVKPVAKQIEWHVMNENDVLSTDETFDMNVKGGRDENGKPCKQKTCVWAFKGEKGKAKYPGTLFLYGLSRTKERLEKSIYDFSHTPVHEVSIHDLDSLDAQQRDALENVLRICEPNLNNRMKNAGSREPEETFEFDKTFIDSVNSEAEKDEWFRTALAKLAEKKLMTSDGYGGYHFLFNIIDIGCMCHDRNKTFRAFIGDRKPEHREVLFELLCLKQEVFLLEQQYKGLSWDDRFKVRLKKTYPIMAKITEICQREYKAAMAAGGLYWEAIRYTINQMPYLYAFLLDGRLEASNMISEITVKVYARLRRNSLFHMTNVGGESDSAYLTILKTAMDWDLVPEKYLTFVLREATKLRPDDLDLLKKGEWVEPLLPHNAPDWCKVNYQPAGTEE